METSDYIISNTHKNINHREKIEMLIKKSKRIRIICPFISKDRAEWLAQYVSNDREIEIVTELTRRGITTGVQLPSTLKILIDKGVKVSFVGGNLHAKLFLFDEDIVLITSANLTNNGLDENFEIGVLLDKNKSPVLAKDVDFSKVNKRINNLWTDLKQKESGLNHTNIEDFLKIELETENLRKEILLQSDESLGLKFKPHSKECENPSQVDNELEAAALFKGFTIKDWEAFDHGLTFTPENLNTVKQILTQKIEPVLKSFYEHFRFSRDLETKLEYFDIGYSKNRWVKNFLPDYRYLWMVRKREGKNPIQHISEPSFIVGMGKHPEHGHWFEIRMGVEELNEAKLTEFGRKFLKNMKNKHKEVLSKFQLLGDGWVLTHDREMEELPNEIAVKLITADSLVAMIDNYLASERVADVHVRRKYYLNNPKDAEILTTNKIINNIAQDMNSLTYFFDLAHKK
nr:hypothetical protein BHI3_08890 [Bacteriovorax sp. HI3]